MAGDDSVRQHAAVYVFRVATTQKATRHPLPSYKPEATKWYHHRYQAYDQQGRWYRSTPRD